ncbi:MAG TPA: hypothetical protein VGI71_24015 [Scandinavium sp.]|jgi:hypothetical protein
MKGMKFDGKSAICGAAGGLLAGGAAGYLLCRHHLRAAMDRRLDEEVARIKSHYNDKSKAFLQTGSPFIGPHSGVHIEDEELPTVGGDSVPDTAPGEPATTPHPLEGFPDEEELAAAAVLVEEQLVQQNAFANAAQHKPKKPYRISRSVFSESPVGTQQLAITYYAGDKTLVDDKDEPVLEVSRIVGALTPLSFGGISEDPHICYVRNEELEVDFEITLDARSYADAVLNYGDPSLET